MTVAGAKPKKKLAKKPAKKSPAPSRASKPAPSRASKPAPSRASKKVKPRASKPAPSRATKPVPSRASKKLKPHPKPARKPAVVYANAEAELAAFAVTLPGAVEDFPWGDRAMKVNKKVFVFLGTHEGGLAMSTKLPRSAAIALTLPFASPTRYGLGKSGWVTAQFDANEKPPVDFLCAWIEESYRAIAPKKLLQALNG